jgi:transcriptional regulator with XRE-family HTH domain
VNEFGRRLKLLRGKMPMSELAEKLETTKAMLSRYENGKIEPGLKALRKIANYFNVTIDWLAGNGSEDEIQYVNKDPYDSVVNKCVKEDISPEKLEQIINVIRK